MIRDRWFTVQRIDDNTCAISEYGHWEKVHSFLLLGDQEGVLIDTGLGIDSIKRITEQLTSLPLKVITTHVHTDHIGNHGEFERIFVHKGDEDWLINGIQGLTIEQIRKNIRRDITLPTPERFNPDTYQPFKGKPTGLLKDDDIFDLGDRRLIIYHTQDILLAIFQFSMKQKGIYLLAICSMMKCQYMPFILQRTLLI